MTFALQTGLFFRRKLLETLRQPVWLISGLITPLLYLALFAPLLRSLAGGPAFPPGHVLDVFVPGVLVLIAFGAGMGAGWPVIWELDSGVIERLRVTPASRFALLLGTVLRDAAMFAVPGVVVIGIAAIFGFHAHWGGLVVLLVLLALLTAACSATSSALGLNLKQIGSLAAVVTGVQLPLTLLSGILLPLSLGPEWLRVLGHLNPMYYAVQASRSLAAGTVLNATVGVGFLVTAAAAALALWWGTRSYHRAMVLSRSPEAGRGRLGTVAKRGDHDRRRARTRGNRAPGPAPAFPVRAHPRGRRLAGHRGRARRPRRGPGPRRGHRAGHPALPGQRRPRARFGREAGCRVGGDRGGAQRRRPAACAGRPQQRGPGRLPDRARRARRRRDRAGVPAAPAGASGCLTGR